MSFGHADREGAQIVQTACLGVKAGSKNVEIIAENYLA
jgi:hypothetical protein